SACELNTSALAATIIVKISINPFRTSIPPAQLYRLDRRCVARAPRPAALGVDAPVVRPDNFLRLTTPDVIRRVEILVGAGRESIQHEIFLRSQRAAEWRLHRLG